MDWSETEERQLVARLRRREPQAFATLVRAFEGRIFNLIYRMLGDAEEARDVGQDVFVTVFRSIGQFRGEARLSTWVYRIATNHCRNRLKYLSRRGGGRSESLDGFIEKPDQAVLGERLPRPDQEAAGYRLEAALQQAIQALDPEHREILVLRDIQGVSYQEIEDITGLPAGTVKSRLHRARLALRERVAPHLAG